MQYTSEFWWRNFPPFHCSLAEGPLSFWLNDMEMTANSSQTTLMMIWYAWIRISSIVWRLFAVVRNHSMLCQPLSHSGSRNIWIPILLKNGKDPQITILSVGYTTDKPAASQYPEVHHCMENLLNHAVLKSKDSHEGQKILGWMCSQGILCSWSSVGGLGWFQFPGWSVLQTMVLLSCPAGKK